MLWLSKLNVVFTVAYSDSTILQRNPRTTASTLWTHPWGTTTLPQREKSTDNYHNNNNNGAGATLEIHISINLSAAQDASTYFNFLLINICLKIMLALYAYLTGVCKRLTHTHEHTHTRTHTLLLDLTHCAVLLQDVIQPCNEGYKSAPWTAPYKPSECVCEWGGGSAPGESGQRQTLTFLL